jgi:hypothetical protein
LPSGKNTDDILNEVRKAAFALRKNKSNNIEEEEEENSNMENNNNNTLMISEEWESWYPQEWLGWCRYGVPCDYPTPYWVTASIADGPVDDVAPFVDDGKSKKKSNSRATQREREMSSISETRQSNDKNTILAHHSFQVDEELRINSTNHDIKLIQMIKDRAKSDAERERGDVLMDKYMEQEEKLLLTRMEYRTTLIERNIKGTDALKSTPVSLSSTTSRPTIAPSHVTSSHVNSEDDYDADETTYECTPMEQFLGDINNPSYIREFHPSASFSGQFSPSSQGDGDSATSQGDFTGPTAPYDEDAEAIPNIINVLPSITENTHKPSRNASLPCSSFSVEVASTSRTSGVSRPPRPTRNNASSVTLQPSRPYITRSSPALQKKPTTTSNPFAGHDWEHVNRLLHGKYHIHHSNPGVIVQDNFNIRGTIQDMEYLRQLGKEDLDDEPDNLELVKMWLVKMKKAIAIAEKHLEMDDSEEEEV